MVGIKIVGVTVLKKLAAQYQAQCTNNEHAALFIFIFILF